MSAPDNGEGTRIMENGFGSRLRTLRTARNLSQAVLGGSRYTAGYISHLESGRRQPTSEVVSYLAATLGVPREQLDPPAVAHGEVADLLDLELELSQSWRDHDRAAVLRVADELADLALQHDRLDVWWRASLDKARVLALQGEMGAAGTLLDSLRRHELATRSRSIAAEALNLTSTVLCWAGQLAEAQHIAYQAVAVTAEMPVGASRRVRALTSLTHVLTTLGDHHEAQRLAGRVTEEIESTGGMLVRAIAHWTVGEAMVAGGSTAAGLGHLQEADRLMSPDVDAYTWGRFLRSSAYRLALSGAHEPLATALARCASAPSSDAPDEAAMEHIARAVGASGADGRETRELADWAADPGSGPVHLRGEATLVAARASPDDGTRRALAHEAERLFRVAGAPWRALAAADVQRGVND